jgi:trehalose 6-phosphate phosphatase
MEIRPRCPTNKGTAVNFLREKIRKDAFPIYIGDDLTDTDAFRVIKGEGLAIQVGEAKLPVAGDYHIGDPSGVARFLRILCTRSSIKAVT